MKLSKKQRTELAVIKYFIPSWVTFAPITHEDLQTFFNWSDKGIPYAITAENERSGLAALHYGKQYREVMIAAWRDDLFNGYTTKAELYSELPEDCIQWVEKALRGTTLTKEAEGFITKFNRSAREGEQ